jgi:Fe-S-cluster containining protein
MTCGSLLEKHDKLLAHLDAWFRSFQSRHSDLMQCGQGCARCCCGLFDISLPDAVRLAKAFEALPGKIRTAIENRAETIQRKICRECAGLEAPFFLNVLSQKAIDQIVDRMPEVRCPLLDEQDGCLLYDDRPLACRLEGVPMVDSHDGLFGDWCELNFVEGVSPELAGELNLDYYKIQAMEQEVTGNLSQYLLAERQEDATVFIPSVIAAFGSFWKLYIKD